MGAPTDMVKLYAAEFASRVNPIALKMVQAEHWAMKDGGLMGCVVLFGALHGFFVFRRGKWGSSKRSRAALSTPRRKRGP